jgi:phosphatidylinositol 4-kinase
LCHSIIPIYIGLCRALGRTPNDDQKTPLFLRLFPSPSLPPKTDESQYDLSKDLNVSLINGINGREIPNSLSKNQTLPNLQKLLPRSFSSLSSNMTWTAGLNTVDSTTDGLSISSLMVANARGSFQSRLSTYNQMNDLVKGARYFFFKFGSSFVGQSRHRKSISSEQKTNETNDIKFSLSHLQKLLTIAKKMLNKDLLQILDEIASNAYGV